MLPSLLADNVGNEIFLFALSLSAILLCVGLRLYSHGIRILPNSNSHVMNSNSETSTTPEQVDVNENASSYFTGSLNTAYMDFLRHRNSDTDTAFLDGVGFPSDKEREDLERELQDIRAHGNIVIRLQFLDGRVRYVHAPPEMPVLLFKRKFFAEEIERQHKSVRLIFQGRELKPASTSRDSPSRRCLNDYGVSDGATIHCLISDAPAQSNSATAAPSPSSSGGRAIAAAGSFHSVFSGGPDDIDFGSQAMLPLFAFLLISVWLFRFAHAQYFSLASTAALTCLTILFLATSFSYGSGGNARRHVAVGVVGGSTSVAAGDVAIGQRV